MESPVLAVIVGCEVGFWVVVFGALAVRYLLRRRRASLVVLALLPLLDVVLLGVVAWDLHQGSAVETVHRLAGIYLGVTVAFAHHLIRWADARFAHWYGDGPAPARELNGPNGFRHEVEMFGRWIWAAAVSIAAVSLLAFTVADGDQARALYGVFPTLGVITVVWLLVGPLWSLADARAG